MRPLTTNPLAEKVIEDNFHKYHMLNDVWGQFRRQICVQSFDDKTFIDRKETIDGKLFYVRVIPSGRGFPRLAIYYELHEIQGIAENKIKEHIIIQMVCLG